MNFFGGNLKLLIALALKAVDISVINMNNVNNYLTHTCYM